MKRLIIAVVGLFIMFTTGDMITDRTAHQVPELPSGPYYMSTGQTEYPEHPVEYHISIGESNSTNPCNEENLSSQELLDVLERAEQRGMSDDPEIEILKDELK